MNKTSSFATLAAAFTIVSACSFSSVAFAEESGANDHSAHTYDSLVNIAPFGVRVGASFGFGSFKNSSGSIPGRTMDTLGFQLMPGYRWSDFLFGVLGEFDFVGQTTDPANVGNQNLKGHTLLFGIGAAYRYQDFDFMAGFEFLGHHNLSNPDPLGQDISYQHPIGFQLQAGYFVLPMVSVDFKFSLVSFKQDSVGGVTSDVSSDKRTHTDYALAVSYHL
jgi:hypothetical protein